MIRARALLLCLLSVYTYLIVPAHAATAATSDPVSSAEQPPPLPAAPATDRPIELSQDPPVKLVPPPPAVAPSPDALTPTTPPAAPDIGTAPGDGQQSQPPSIVDVNYILGPGDKILVQDYSSGDFGQPVSQPVAPILPDGTIEIHPLGLVKAAGLSVGELAAIVNQRAAQFIIKPDLRIIVTDVRPNTVYILGEVVKPGLYSNQASPIIGGQPIYATTASLTVVSALQKAGGIKESADVRNIRVSRLGTTEQLRVNLWQLLSEGDTKQDITLMAGDVIYVPKGGTQFNPDELGVAANPHRRVRIWGAVKSPGLLDMEPDDDVLSVLAKTGGFTPTAIKSWVWLSRLNRDGTLSTRKISIKRGIRDPDSIARMHVKPGDLVMVHDSLLKKGAFTLYQASVYFAYAIGIVTYSVLFSNAVQQRNQNSSNNNPATVSVFTPTVGGGGGGAGP